MAFMNCFLNFNINIGQPRFGFNFGCFAMPNFFTTMPIFNCFNNFSAIPFFQQYNNPIAFNSPSVFSSLNTIPMPSFNLNNSSIFSNYQTDYSNMWQQTSVATPSFDTIDWSYSSNSLSKRKSSSKDYSNSTYASLSRSAAISKAEADSNLEKLTGGTGWSISNASFKNDIPYAAKGVGNFLNKLTQEIGENLTITSALGTKNSPHAKNGGHYSDTNPKLDFGGGLSVAQAKDLERKLNATEYFEFVKREDHGDGTAHLDVKIKSETLAKHA